MGLDPTQGFPITPAGRVADRLGEFERRLSALERGGPDLSPVATLPTNPRIGQLVCYQTAAMAAAGIEWYFRNSGASPYPWRFVGGSDLYDIMTGAAMRHSAGSGVWMSLTAGDPTIVTVPLVGVYDTTFQATGQEMDNTAVAADVYTGVFGNGVQWTNTFDAWGRPTGAFHKWDLYGTARLTTAVVNTTLETKVLVNAGSWNSFGWYTGTIRARPVRVAA